jgi:predicted RNA-binding Zn-ribbon protein involved in translation (DUF1610 family)
MCECHAACPNCGQVNLDEDESFCMTLDGIASREYHCHECGALITVQVRVRADVPQA